MSAALAPPRHRTARRHGGPGSPCAQRGRGAGDLPGRPLPGRLLHLVVFFIVPAYLALTTTSITSAAAHPVLARAGTTARWQAWSICRSVAPTAAITTVWLAAGAVGTLGLTWQSSPISPAGMMRSQVLQALAAQSDGVTLPTWAYAPAQVLLLFVGLLALRAVVALVHLLTHSPGAAALVATGLWIATILSFELPFEGNVGSVDALVPHQAGQHLPWWATTAIPAAAITAPLGLGPVVDRAAAPRPAKGASPLARATGWVRRPGALYALVVAGAVLAVIPQAAATATTPWEVFISLAWGTSPDGVVPVTFAAFTIVFAGFAHLVALQPHDQLGDRLPYVMIRHRSMTGWTLRLLARCTAQGVALLAGVFVLTSVAGHLLVDAPAASVATGPDPDDPVLIMMSGAALHQFALNGVLQLSAHSVALFLAAWWTRSPIWTLGAIATIAALHLPGANAGGWIIGLNSVGMLTTASPTRMSAELLALNTVLIIAALWSVTRSTSTIYERS